MADASPQAGERHIQQATQSLRKLLNDAKIPAQVRAALSEEYRQLEALCDKLQHGDIHIGVFGKVSAGKSSLLNALMGQQTFTVSPLHGATQHSRIARWQHQESQIGGVHLIDTPGINEIDGHEREQMAHDVAKRCDLVLFVTDADLTAIELAALKTISQQQRPILCVLNKSDRYQSHELDTLKKSITQQTSGLIQPENIVTAAADPRPETLIRIDSSGQEQRTERQRAPQLDELKQRLWDILEKEGRSLAALNATLFAGHMSDELARRLAATRRQLAEKVTRAYCLGKGLAVAVNPIPVADLLAAASLDVLLVKQLSQIYGLPLTRREPGELLLTIAAQLAALMGAVWGVNLVSSTLKGMSAGLSTTITAGAQGALAWYATYLVGRATEAYLIAGKSWGEGGPKQVVQSIINDLDRKSILAEAKKEILQKLRLAS